MITDIDKQMMRRAVELSVMALEADGLPFGAVIVQDGQVIAEGRLSKGDPTAHAEMEAIRQAAEKLGRADLSDCYLYTSCEPCLMCLGAVYWTKLAGVFYANTQYDAKLLGLDDAFIYKQLNQPYDQRSIPFQQVLDATAIEVFDLAALRLSSSD